MPNEQGKKTTLHKKHIARLQREKQQSQVILYTFIGIMAAVVILIIYGYLDIKYFQLKRPVAKVGDSEILVQQFEARVRLQRKQLLSQYGQYAQYAQYGLDVASQLDQIKASLNAPQSIGQGVLDQMIDEELVRQEAIKRGITISDAELAEGKQGMFSYYPNGSPTPTMTPTEVVLPEAPADAYTVVTQTPIPPTATPEIVATDALPATATPETVATLVLASATPTATAGPTSTITPTATPYTLDGYQTQVSNSLDNLKKLGFDDSVYQTFFENQLYTTKLKELLTADITPIQKQVWARHILVADEAAAIVVIEKLKAGDDFATLAKSLSTDTGSAVNGGDLGWFASGAMVPEFETAAFALEKPGDYTLTPVKSQFGYHIIQLIAKQDRPLTAEQLDAAKNKAFTEWLTAAREEYGVTIYDIWKERIPTDPNFTTIATEAADAQNTAIAEQKATATP